MSCSTPVEKVAKSAEKVAKVAKATAKAAKKIVEKLTSSESTNLTSSFTNTISEVEKTLSKSDSYMNMITNIIASPKFKWAIVLFMLCLISFYYFKFQSKKNKFSKEQSDNKKPIQEDFLKQQAMMKQNLLRKQLEEQEQAKMHAQMQAQLHAQALLQAQMQEQAQMHKKQPIKKQKVQELLASSDESSEEVFIEDNKVMEHNLTADEMHAIDKQLEDVDN